ncbi:hypothetical protein QEN19_000587 [Hanseniaspora menglaensis]
MEYINTGSKENTESGSNSANKIEEHEEHHENDPTNSVNPPGVVRGRRDSTSMLLTAAFGDFDNNSNIRQSRLSLSMFDDPPIRDSLRSLNNNNNNNSSSGQLVGRSNTLDDSIAEASEDGSIASSQDANSKKYFNKNMSKRSSFLRDSIDLNAELMMGSFAKSSKETSGEPKVTQSDDEFLKFNLPEINKNINSSVSPYMGPTQHKPLGFANRKFSFGGLISGRKDSMNADGVIDSFLGLNGKDDDLFLTQRRNSSLSVMMRPSIIGMDKFKSLQNESAISDGDEEEYNEKKHNEKDKIRNSLTNNPQQSLNKTTPNSRSVSRQMSVTNGPEIVKHVAPALTTPVMLMKNHQPPSTLNPSSIKDNTILESTKKISLPNTLHPVDSDISAYARLDFADSTFYVQTLKVTLGRKPNTNDPSQTGVVTAQQVLDSNKDNVDVNLGFSKNISRKHAQIYYNFANEQFEMTVLGKNGAFVNDEFIGKNVTVGLNNDTKIQIANIPFIFVQDASSISEYCNTDRFKTKEEIDNENNIKKENAKKAINEKKKESLKKKKEEKAALEMLAKQQQLHMKGQKQQQQKKLQQEKDMANKRAAQATMTVLASKETTPKRQKKKEYQPEEIPVEHREKPNISYNAMILNAFKRYTSTDGQTMSLTNIYETMKELYPYYEYCSKGWQSSVRHALQTNKTFTKGPKEGKSWLWMIDKGYLKEKELEEKKLLEEKKKTEEANKEAKKKFFQRLPQAVNHKESQDAKQKRTLIYLQKQLMILTTDRQGLDKETISQVLTKALASTIQKVNEVSKKIGMTKHPLGFLMDKNPQQLNFILAAACNASLKEVTGSASNQIVKLPTPQELARDLDEAKKEYFTITGKVWEQPKDIKPPIKKLTLKQQRLKEAQLKADAAEAALKKIQETKNLSSNNILKSSTEAGSTEIKKTDSISIKLDDTERPDLASERGGVTQKGERRNIPNFALVKIEGSKDSSSKTINNVISKSESPVFALETTNGQYRTDTNKRKTESELKLVTKKVKVDNKIATPKQVKKNLGPTTSVINLQPNMKNTSVLSSGEQITTTGTLSKKVVPINAKKSQMVSKAPVYRPSSITFDPSSLSKFFQAKNQNKAASVVKTNSSESLSKTVSNDLHTKPLVKKPISDDDSSSSDDDSGSSDGSGTSSDDDDSSDASSDDDSDNEVVKQKKTVNPIMDDNKKTLIATEPSIDIEILPVDSETQSIKK